MKLRTVRVQEDEYWQTGHCTASRVALWKGERFLLSAGTKDEVYYCTDEAGRLYALSLNYGLGYIGLEMFDAELDNEAEAGYQKAEGSVFTSQPEELKDYGLPLLEMAGFNAIKYLAEYL